MTVATLGTATCQKHANGLFIYIPKHIIDYLRPLSGDVVEIEVKKLGIRKRPKHRGNIRAMNPYYKKENDYLL